MLSIAVCDDNRIIVEEIQRQIRECLVERGTHYHLDCCLSARALRSLTERNKYDLIFLDIELQDGNGFELAKELIEKDCEAALIFISSHEQFVFQSYEYEPFWFIRKSDLHNTMQKALKKFLKKMEETAKYYCFGQGSKSVTLRLSNILYIECSGHTLSIHSWKQELAVVYGNLKPLEKSLGEDGFIRIHKNYIINIDKIFSIGSSEIELINHEKLPLSKDRKGRIKQMLLERK